MNQKNRTQEELRALILKAIQDFDPKIRDLSESEAEFVSLVLNQLGYDTQIHTDSFGEKKIVRIVRK